MATYRAVLLIDVDDCDIARSRGEETLEALKAESDDYLLDHIENEMGWLEESFSCVEIESVTRVDEDKNEQNQESPIQINT